MTTVRALMENHNDMVERERRLFIAILKFHKATQVREILRDRSSLENQTEAYIELRRCMLNKDAI